LRFLASFSSICEISDLLAGDAFVSDVGYYSHLFCLKLVVDLLVVDCLVMDRLVPTLACGMEGQLY
jgi:hypothetical protein